MGEHKDFIGTFANRRVICRSHAPEARLNNYTSGILKCRRTQKSAIEDAFVVMNRNNRSPILGIIKMHLRIGVQ